MGIAIYNTLEDDWDRQRIWNTMYRSNLWMGYTNASDNIWFDTSRLIRADFTDNFNFNPSMYEKIVLHQFHYTKK